MAKYIKKNIPVGRKPGQSYSQVKRHIHGLAECMKIMGISIYWLSEKAGCSETIISRVRIGSPTRINIANEIMEAIKRCVNHL
jgi:hypothetical protein